MPDYDQYYDKCWSDTAMCSISGGGNCTLVDWGTCGSSYPAHGTTYCTQPNITAEHCTTEVRSSSCSVLFLRFNVCDHRTAVMHLVDVGQKREARSLVSISMRLHVRRIRNVSGILNATMVRRAP